MKACQLCGARGAVQAHCDHQICTTCTEQPQRIRRRFDQVRAACVAAHHDAVRRYEEAVAALTVEERQRWTALGETWVLHHAGLATPDQARRIAATLEALKQPAHPKMTAGLRAVYVAWEHERRARAAVEDCNRRLDIALAALAVCLEDLGRQSDADALYAPRSHVPVPTTADAWPDGAGGMPRKGGTTPWLQPKPSR
jgi:hypothetical protein